MFGLGSLERAWVWPAMPWRCWPPGRWHSACTCGCGAPAWPSTRAGPDLWRLRRNELAAIAHIGLPGAAENGGWRLAFMVSMAAVGTMGASALATHAYVQQVMMVVLLFGLATGLSVEVLVGHQVGAGHLRQAHGLVQAARWRAGSLVSVTVATAGGTGRALAAAPCSPRTRTDHQHRHHAACGGRCCWSRAAPST